MNGGGDLDELRAALRADAAGIAQALLGAPNKTSKSRKALRFGSKGGSLVVEVQGPKKGLWHEWSSDKEGGDLLDLIQRERNCGFADAVSWARGRTGLAAELPDNEVDQARRAALDADRAARRAEAEARAKIEAEAERRASVEWVRRLAKATVPAKGTLADYYLTQHRGIPRPKDGCWPDAVRWHPGYRALVMVATQADGSVQCLQRIHLDAAGGKVGADEMARRDLKAVKQTHGVMAGAVVRLPGDPAGPLLVAEGPETGLAVWSSTGHQTWIALGSIGRVEMPPGRRVILVSDDNPPPTDAKRGAAARALDAAVEAWRQAGITLSIATPWAARRHDTSDLADVILLHGVEAVRSRIGAAETVRPVSNAPPRLPAYYAAPTEPRDAALARQRALIRDTIEVGAVSGGARHKIAKMRKAAVEADPDFDLRSPAEKGAVTRRIKKAVLAELSLARLPPPSRILITGSQGSGKTRTSLETVAGLTADLVVRITQPSHDKAAEVLADYEAIATAASLPALLVRGRGSFDPTSSDEERMCLRHDVAARAARKGVSVRKAICASCPFEASCGYIRQEQQIKAMDGRGVFIAARAYNFLPCPAPTADILIADESITLEAIDDVLSEAPGILKSPVPFEGANLASVMTANQVTSRLGDVLTGPKPLAKLRTDGPRQDELLFAKDMLERAIEARQAAVIDGSMSDAEIHAALDNQQANLAGSALAILNAVLRELDQPRDVFNGIEYVPDARVVVNGREERQPRLRVHRLRPLHGITQDTTVLLLDGTGSERLNRALLPNLVHHRIGVERDAHVTGTTGRNYSRQSCTGEDRNGEPIPNKAAAALRLRQEVKQIAARLPGDTLLVASLKAADKLRDDGIAPADLVAHFGKVRGRNQWEGCESVLCLGAEAVSVEAVETLSRPFMTNDPVPFLSSAGPIDADWPYQTWPFKATRGRRMRDGTVQPVEVEVHPDPRVQEVLEQVREAELLQAGDRVRPIFNRRTMVFANSLALDLTYDRTWSHKELVAGGSRLERVFAALGLLPLGARDLHTADPILFPSPKAAEKALQPDESSTPLSQIVSYLKKGGTYSYRLKGQRGTASRALIDTERHPNPRLALEALLGDLAGDQVLVPPTPPSPDPPPPAAPQPDPDPPAPRPPPPPPPASDDADADDEPPPGHPAWDRPPVEEPDGWEPVQWDGGMPAGLDWSEPTPAPPPLRDAPWLYLWEASGGIAGGDFGVPGDVLAHPLSPRARSNVAKAILNNDLADVCCQFEKETILADFEVPDGVQRGLAGAPLGVAGGASPGTPDTSQGSGDVPLVEPPPLTCDAPWLHPEVPAFALPSGGTVLRCPFCHQQHRHGGFGPRLAHCLNPQGRGYVLVQTENAPPWLIPHAPAAAPLHNRR